MSKLLSENLNIYPENFILLNHPETFDQIEIGDNLRIDFSGMVIRCDEILFLTKML